MTDPSSEGLVILRRQSFACSTFKGAITCFGLSALRLAFLWTVVSLDNEVNILPQLQLNNGEMVNKAGWERGSTISYYGII